MAPGPDGARAVALVTGASRRKGMRNPLARMGRPEDCASLVTFLCSAEGGWINGQLLRSDGGQR